MDNYSKTNNLLPSPWGHLWGWMLVWGIILIILGVLAIGASVLTTIVSVIFLGIMLIAGGIIVIIDSFSLFHHKWGVFLWRLGMGILYVIVGFMLIQRPLLGSISITLFLGIFYLVIGISRLIDAFSGRLPQWGWAFFSGLVSLLLGILILINWPVSGLFIIGLFIGIDLLILGWAYVMTSIAMHARVVS